MNKLFYNTLYNQSQFLSAYIIPSLMLIYIFYKSSRSILFLHFISIFFTGLTDTIVSKIIDTKYTWFLVLRSLFFHLIFILPLFYFNKKEDFNKKSIFVLFGCLLIIYGFPVWKYNISRTILFILYLIYYIISYLIVYKL